MSVFALNEIIKAEQEAHKIKENATFQSKAILSSAVADGEKLIKNTQTTSEQKIQDIMADCKNKIMNISDASHTAISQKIQELKNVTRDKIPSAVKYIVDSII